VVLGALLELAPSGVEQVDGDGWVEYAVYGAPGELPALEEGEAEVAGVLVRVSGREVPGDWEERWKRFHAPVLVGGRVWVRPPWDEPAARPGTIDLIIDPGQAFGTGAHPTTRLCLELLLELQPPGSVADIGEQSVGKVVLLPELQMAGDRVRRHAEDLDPGGDDAPEVVAQGARLGRAAGGVVLGVEIEDVPLSEEALARHG